MTVTITIDSSGFNRQLDDLAYEQVPFATALALTRTAEEGVQSVIGDLPSHFHVRNGWVAKGFRVKGARKNKLVAEISHKDPYMLWQMEGGTKRPTSVKHVAIPHGRKFAGARGSITETTPKRKWPGRLKRSFAVKKPDGTVYVFVRQGKRMRKRHKSRYDGRLLRDIQLEQRGLDPNLKLMYVMKSSVRVPKRWPFFEEILKVAHARFELNLAAFLKYAIRTAK